jgi:hypothetical protein
MPHLHSAARRNETTVGIRAAALSCVNANTNNAIDAANSTQCVSKAPDPCVQAVLSGS